MFMPSGFPTRLPVAAPRNICAIFRPKLRGNCVIICPMKYVHRSRLPSVRLIHPVDAVAANSDPVGSFVRGAPDFTRAEREIVLQVVAQEKACPCGSCSLPSG